MSDLVVAILVNYNGVKDTNECVKSLLSCGYSQLRIVIVDNASFAEERPVYNEVIINDKCIIIYNDINYGFSGANNIGIRYAIEKLKAKYVLILNNDTVVREGFLQPLVQRCSNNQNIGIAIGKIFFENNSLYFAGSHFDSKSGVCKIDGYNNTDSDDYNCEKDIPFASGCMWLIPSNVFKVVGLLSEDYFLYYEDNDYCDKVIDKRFTIRYVPDSVIVHKGSKSTHKNLNAYNYYLMRNYLLYIKKTEHLKNIQKIRLYIRRFADHFLVIIKRKLPAKVVFFAWYDFICGRKGKSERFS